MTDVGYSLGEAAAAWVVRLNSDQLTRADEEGFRLWLEADPAHGEAYADALATWDGVRDLVATEEARAALRRLRAPVRPRPRLSRRSAVFGGAGGAMAASFAGLAGYMALDGARVLQTAPGRQKRARLADGSSVLLNTDTRLQIRFSEKERRLVLDHGQAFFQVAKDPARPFRVFVGQDEVRAIGTAFEVRRIGDLARVTLEEGRVAIYRRAGSSGREVARPEFVGAAAPAPPLTPIAMLEPGEQADVASGTSVTTREVDLRKVQAWRYGRMILDDAPLGDVVADLNRYGGTQILLAEPQLAEIRVSGVFHTGRPEDFVDTVAAAFPLRIDRGGDSTIVLRSR